MLVEINTVYKLFNLALSHRMLAFSYTMKYSVAQLSEMSNFEMVPNVSVNFISLVTSCLGLPGEKPETAHLMSFTWASYIAASVLTGH